MHTWRSWDLVLPLLEQRYDVFAPTLPCHAGGPDIDLPLRGEAILDELERILDAAGIGRARLVGNSLGGYMVLKLAERGRAESVVALAPAGGWPDGDSSFESGIADHFVTVAELVREAAPRADEIVSTPEGRRQATAFSTVRFEHIPAELLAHQIRGGAGCDYVRELLELSVLEGWELDPARIDCPVRIVWGTDDLLLPWPSSATRYREWLPDADWVVLDGVGHVPQLDVPLETAELITEFAGS